MSRKIAFMLAAMVLLIMLALPVYAAPQIGQPAPDFTATDIDGNEFTLSEFKGKKVILEWTNHQCPFVVKHYGSGNMQATQKTATDKGVIWVSIVSSAEGNQGHVTPDEARTIMTEADAHPSAKILDPSGTIGHLYEASTTPHMFVIDEEGILAYAGAIDSKSSPNPATIEGATNYVLAALDDLEADRPVATAQTQPYGCGVKYSH
ncbi:MAG: thioredoxin family protein [Micavibrio sp.]|nr:MAG: thioredoxin family protein [Micavibrio sp.]